MTPVFGASTWLWTSPFRSENIEVLETISRLGFGAVELPVEDPALVDAAALGPVLRDLGLRPHVCGAFGPGRDLTSADPAERVAAKACLNDCFRIAAALGAGFVCGPMHARVGKARQLPEDERKRGWDLAVTELREVCHAAAGHGPSVSIEPINRFETGMVNTVDDALRDIGYGGSVVIESFTPDNRDLAAAVCIWKRFTATRDEFAARGLAFLKQLFT